MSKLDFDANAVDPTTDFEPIPEAKYLACITDSIEKPTKKGDGAYLALTFDILEGQYKGRKLWANLTLKHPNEQTVQIAKANLSAICRAVGVMAPKDSAELHSLPLILRVGLKKREDTGALQNVIRAYLPKDKASAETIKPAESVRTTPPWKRTAKA